MWLIESFVRNPIKVTVGILLVGLFGLIALFQMPMQLTPEVEVPTLSVETRWPGASPQEVEREIIVEQEEQLKSVEGLTKLSSESTDSSGKVILEFLIGTDIDEALLKVNSRLQQVQEYPEDADQPVISTSNASDRPIAWFILGPRLPTDDQIQGVQKRYANNKELVQGLQLIRQTENSGLAVFRIRQLAQRFPEAYALYLPTAELLNEYVELQPQLKPQLEAIGQQAAEDPQQALTSLRELIKQQPTLQPLVPLDIEIEKLLRFTEDNIEARFERVPGVSNSNVFGGLEDEMQVIVDPQLLAARGLTVADLRQVLKAENKDTSGGDFWEGKRRYVVRTLGQFRKPEDVENTLVANIEGRPVYVRDVATVQLGYKKPSGVVRRFGEGRIAVNAERETGSNVLDVMAGLQDTVGTLNGGLLRDRGLELTQVYDETEYIDSSVELVQQNIFLGGSLTMIVLMLFLHRSLRTLFFSPLIAVTALAAAYISPWFFVLTLGLIFLCGFWFARGALVVGLAIPCSIVGTFLILNFLGRSLNVISLAGLAFAVGMLVDNAVVVLENIYSHWQRGERPLQACVAGTAEVWGAVVASTITTIAVFLPVIFVQEEAGQLFRDIALAISSAVGLSLLVSVTLIPTASARLLRRQSAPNQGPPRTAASDHWTGPSGNSSPQQQAGLSKTGSSETGSSETGSSETGSSETGRGEAKNATIQQGHAHQINGKQAGPSHHQNGHSSLNGPPQGPGKSPQSDGSGRAWGGRLSEATIGAIDTVGTGVARFIVGVNAWAQQGVFRRLGLAALLVCLALGTAWALWPKVEYLPQGNRNLVFGILLPPPGYNIDQLMALGERVEQQLKPHWDVPPGTVQPEGQTAPAISDFFFVARGRSVFMGVRSADPLRAGELVPVVMQTGLSLPGTFAVASQSSLFARGLEGGRTIDVEITGPELTTLVGLGGQVLGMAKQAFSPDTQMRPVPSLDLSSPEVHVESRRFQAAEMQVDTETLGYAVNALVDGAYAGDYYLGGDKIDLTIVGQTQYADRSEDLEALPVATPDGQLIPLGALASVTLSSGPEQVNHRERLRAITIQITPPESMPLEEAMQTIQSSVVAPLSASGQLGNEYTITLAGTADKLESTWEALKWNVLLALLITYLLMAALYESWLYPLVIIFSVPLGAVGGIIGLRVLNLFVLQNLDVLTMLGFVILIGTVVNNAILIVDHALQLIRGGEASPRKAIVHAVRGRVRPIFMTTSTTVLGLLPLVLFPGAGSELYRGLGSVVLGGLIVSTVFTLFLVPSVFTLTLEAQAAVSKFLQHLGWRDEPSQEPLETDQPEPVRGPQPEPATVASY